MHENRNDSIWRPPSAVVEQPGARHARSLWRSAVVGLLVSVCTLVTLSFVAGVVLLWHSNSIGMRFSTATELQTFAMGLPLFRITVPVFWSTAMMAGGFTAGWSTGGRWATASAIVAALFLLVWAIPSTLLVGAPSLPHIIAIACAVPAAVAGGFLASRIAG